MMPARPEAQGDEDGGARRKDIRSREQFGGGAEGRQAARRAAAVLVTMTPLSPPGLAYLQHIFQEYPDLTHPFVQLRL